MRADVSPVNSKYRVDLSYHVHFVKSVITALHLYWERTMNMASSSGLLICFIVTFLFTASSAAPVEITAMKRSPAVPEIAGAPVVFGPGTYPRGNKLSYGSILGTYTAFNGGDNIIETVLSKDDGESWYISTISCLKERC